MHPTKNKGDLATSKIISDLITKDIDVLLPFSEHLRYDMAVRNNGIFYRLQVKYSTNGMVRGSTQQHTKTKKTVKYSINDFDYYAIYLPQIDIVIYPSIVFSGCTIRCTLPNSYAEFFWYEDFLNFTDTAPKHKASDFDHVPKVNYNHNRRTDWPTKDVLQKLLWEKPITQIALEYQVSDKAVSNWVTQYNLKSPPRGHWIKKRKNK